MRSPYQQATLERLRSLREKALQDAEADMAARRSGAFVLVVWRKGHHDSHAHKDPACSLIDGPVAELPAPLARRRGNDACPKCFQ